MVADGFMCIKQGRSVSQVHLLFCIVSPNPLIGTHRQTVGNLLHLCCIYVDSCVRTGALSFQNLEPFQCCYQIENITVMIRGSCLIWKVTTTTFSSSTISWSNLLPFPLHQLHNVLHEHVHEITRNQVQFKGDLTVPCPTAQSVTKIANPSFKSSLC